MVIFSERSASLDVSFKEPIQHRLNVELASGNCNCDLSKYALQKDLEELEGRVDDVEVTDAKQDYKMTTIDNRVVALEESTTSIRSITAEEIDSMF